MDTPETEIDFPTREQWAGFARSLVKLQTDAEWRRQRERNAADLTAVHARFLNNPHQAIRQEELIKDARVYAKSFFGEASSSEARLSITRRIWERFLPKRDPKFEVCKVLFSELHAAIWTEGWPSLEEQAERLRTKRFVDETHRVHVLLFDQVLKRIKLEAWLSDHPGLGRTSVTDYRGCRIAGKVSPEKREEIEAAIVSSAKKLGLHSD